MSMKARSMLGALLLFGGLLIITAGGISKSNARIQYERDVEKHRPDPRVPENGAANVVMVLGGLVSVAGLVMIGLTVRDMTHEIGDAQSRAEAQMRMEVAEKRDAKPKI